MSKLSQSDGLEGGACSSKSVGSLERPWIRRIGSLASYLASPNIAKKSTSVSSSVTALPYSKRRIWRGLTARYGTHARVSLYACHCNTRGAVAMLCCLTFFVFTHCVILLSFWWCSCIESGTTVHTAVHPASDKYIKYWTRDTTTTLIPLGTTQQAQYTSLSLHPTHHRSPSHIKSNPLLSTPPHPPPSPHVLPFPNPQHHSVSLQVSAQSCFSLRRT